MSLAARKAPASSAHGPRELGQHREPGADVLAALGVVGRQPGHAVRPRSLSGGLPGVEVRHRDAELARVAADLVQRDEPGIAIEGGVLDPLRHGRAAELLHPPGELVVRVVQAVRECGQGSSDSRAPLARQSDRRVQPVRPARQVGPVDRERHGQFRDRGSGIGYVGGQHGQPTYLGDEQSLDHHPLADLDVLGDGGRVTGQALVERGQLRLGGAVDEQAAHLAHRVVPGGAGHRPRGRSSPGSRIFSTVIQAPGASAANRARYSPGSTSPSG